jgi:hypothetical protein
MRLVLLLALVLPAMPAQNFQRQIKMKPLLPPINQPWKSPNSGPRLLIAATPRTGTSPCSIPLLPAKPVETGDAIVVAPRKGNFAMRMVTPPAPPCEPPQR